MTWCIQLCTRSSFCLLSSPKLGVPATVAHAIPELFTAGCVDRLIFLMVPSAHGFPFSAETASESGVLGAGVGIEGSWAGGARRPVGQGPDAARRPASIRNSAVSGQAAAKWMRMRAAFSTTQAPILRMLWPSVASGVLRAARHCEGQASASRPRCAGRGGPGC